MEKWTNECKKHAAHRDVQPYIVNAGVRELVERSLLGKRVSDISTILHASHAAFPLVTLSILPYINVTLTFDFDFGLDHLVHARYRRGYLTLRRKKVTVKQRN
jgi:hypothetical protein